MSWLKGLVLAITVLLGWAGFSMAAYAQEMDYGALESMFGEPVTTSATGAPLRASQVPADMQIVSADQIRQSGATNIPDILRYIAGIDVRSYGANDNEVSVRGYSQADSSRLLVLINGRQVYLDNDGFTAWQTLPVQLADIRQIEIVRGPASALFGFNAVAGVINIITYDPLFDRTNTLQFGVGTDGTWQGALVSTLNLPGKGGVTVQIGGIRTDQYALRNLPAYLGPYSSRTRNGSYAVDGRYKPNDNTEMTIEVTQSQADGLEEDAGYQYFRIPYRNESLKAGLSVNSSIGTVSLLGYINAERDAYTAGEFLPLASQNQVGVLQLSDLFKIADVHAIRIGVEYRNNRESGDITGGSLHYNDFAGDAMWNWQIDPALSFTAAGRIDHLKLMRNDPEFPEARYTIADYQGAGFTSESYNLGLVWQATAQDTIRLLTGRAVQAPSLIAYGVQLLNPATAVRIVYAGDPDLKPAITTNYEADYDRLLPGSESSLHAALFYNITEDIIAAGPNAPIGFTNGVLSAYSQNIGRSKAAGAEFGLQGSDPSGWRWNLSYSLLGVYDKLLFGPPQSPAGWDNATPASVIDFGLGYSWRQWEADLSGHWQSDYKDILFDPGPTGVAYVPVNIHNYITMSGRIGYQVTPHLTLAVAGQQLTGTQIVESTGLEPERRVLFTATLNF